MRSRYSTKFFPFAPGIPWKIKNSKWVVPEIDHEIWRKAVSERDVVVCAHGGLFESLMSLSFIEALKINNTSFGVQWLGHAGYQPLVRAQGLARICEVKLEKEQLSQFPVPLFFDAENRAYLNALNNYVETVSWNGKHRFTNAQPLVQQLFANSMVGWSDEYIPKLRRVSELQKYKEWRRTYRFDRSRYVLVILGSGFSRHGVDCLGWNERHIRALAGLVHQFELPVVVATNHPGRLHGTNVTTAPMELEVLLGLAARSTAVLAQDWDWLMAALMISNAAVISKHIGGVFDLYRNAEQLSVTNDIFTVGTESVMPMDVFRYCEGL